MIKTLKQYLFKRKTQCEQSILLEKLTEHILTELDRERMVETGIGMGYTTNNPFLIVTRAANHLKRLKAYD